MSSFAKILSATLVLLSFAGCDRQADAELESFTLQGREVAATYGRALKAELQAAMTQGGPVAGIAVCHEAAPAIASAVGTDKGVSVGRTSLRVRNPANAPDHWERGVLNAFEEAASSGADLATLEYVEKVSVEGRSMIRYMKAIPTDALCLTCHGSDIDDEVVQLIDDYYPDDQARNFAVGDIRGAFTVTKGPDPE